MVNLFDRHAKTTFGINSRVMGYPATWTPSDDSGEKSARILYKDPTEVSKILQLEYYPHNYALEYKEGDFPGLKALADQSQETGELEQVVITFSLDPLTQVTYYVRMVHTITDGKVYLATLEKV
jgi:hypothetical protein